MFKPGNCYKTDTWNCSKLSVLNKEQAVHQRYVTICCGHV